MSGNSGSIDFANQEDPSLLLLQNSNMTLEYDLGLQGAVSRVTETYSQVATARIAAGDADLESISDEMSAVPSGTAGTAKMEELNALYNTRQTLYGNINNQFSSGLQGLGTTESGLTTAQQNIISLCQAVIESVNNALQQLSGW